MLFLASGFASLLLEVTWARQLSLVTGSGVRTSGAVAALMLGGLAAGAALAGFRVDRMRRPLRAYALAETGIALWAGATPFLLPFLSRLLPVLHEGSSTGLDFSWRALLIISILVLPASLLMGSTTPVMTRAHCLMSPSGLSRETTARSLGLLYGWNTLGGAAGALAAAFAILPHLGLRATIFLAAGIDLVVALGAGWIRVPAATSSAASLPSTKVATRLPPERRVRSVRIRTALVLAGALGATCQVAWTRLLTLYFGSSVQGLALTLAVCLLGLAAGSLGMTRLLSRGAMQGRWDRRLWSLAAGSLVLTLPMWGVLPVLVVLAQARLGASFAMGLVLQALLCSILVLPTAIALGALLPALVDSLGGGVRGPGEASASGYALDSAGSVLGGLAASYFLLPALGASAMLRMVVVLFAMLVLFQPLRSVWRRSRSRVAQPLLASAVIGSLALLLPRWDPLLVSSGPLLYGPSYVRAGGATWSGVHEAMRRRGKLLFFDEGPDATVTVRQSPTGGRSLQINGKTDASDSGDLSAQMLAGRIPALLHAAPARALVIGLASGTTAAAVVTQRLARLDCVEIVPGVARAAAQFESIQGGILHDERFHLFLGDGRSFLQQGRDLYDVIVSQPTNPWIAGVTNLFTREFFQAVHRRLAPGGVALVWVQGYAMAPEDFKSVVGTFRDTFSQAQLWEESAGGGDYFLVAQRGGAPPRLSDIATRWSEAPGSGQAEVLAGFPDFLGRFLASGAALEAFSREAPRITDDNLRLEYSAPREIWKNRLPELLASLEAIRQSPVQLFPDLAEPAHRLLRSDLARRERGRRERIRIAVSLRREDLEALGSPGLSSGLHQIRAGRAARALPFLAQARLEAPRAPVVPLLQGWILLGEARPEDAERAFRAARSLDSGDSHAAGGLGIALYRQGRLEEAAGAFQEAMKADPHDSYSVSNLGAVRLAEGRDSEALALLERALRMDPGHDSARINRGVALARLGRVEEAIGEYRRVLEKDPENDDARYNLARALERLGKTAGVRT
ncbi:MAG TPA: fused MFS/spermidine synthase [Candidatus Polarisedimenticolia bacterium]|nr:fused MFS/spermidine synthase [Candidatus Polarisedimenticolia bacterium]